MMSFFHVGIYSPSSRYPRTKITARATWAPTQMKPNAMSMMRRSTLFLLNQSPVPTDVWQEGIVSLPAGVGLSIVGFPLSSWVVY